VEQGADRGGRGHGFGDPGVERDLDGFGDQGDEHENEDAACEAVGDGGIGPEGRTGAGIDDEDGGEQAVAGDVGHQQDFACSGDSFAVGVPEADQAEGAETDDFPAEIEDKEVSAVNEADKGSYEDEHRSVETRGGPVVGHVVDGVEQNEAAEKRAHEGKEEAECVDVENECQRAVPEAEVQVDGLAGGKLDHGRDNGSDGRQAGEKGEDAFGAGGKELRQKDLQHGTQQERAWRHQDEGRGCHGSDAIAWNGTGM